MSVWTLRVNFGARDSPQRHRENTLKGSVDSKAGISLKTIVNYINLLLVTILENSTLITSKL